MIGWLDLLAVQGTLKSLLQHHSSKSSVLQGSAFFIVQLSHPYMITGKTIALTKQKVKMKSLSRIRLLATPWTSVYQAPPSMGFSRQEYWSGVPLPSPKPTIRSDQISRSVMSDSLRPHESQHARPPCPSATPGVH